MIRSRPARSRPATRSLAGLAGALLALLVAAPPALAVPPANDSFASAETLSGSSDTATGTNVDATKETGEPDHAFDRGGASVWYTWQAPSSGLFRIDTCASDFDTLLAVYTGTAVNLLSEVASNDEGVQCASASQLVFEATSGTTYRIAVDGWSAESQMPADTGNIGLNLAPEPPPANDNFASAQVLPSSSFVEGSGDNFGATKELFEPDHAGDSGGASVWYRWTAPITGSAYVDACWFDSMVGVYTGSAINSLTPVASDFCFVEFQAVAGTQYRIAVDGFSNGGADPPAQDFFFLYLELLPPSAGNNFGVPPLSPASDNKPPKSKIRKLVIDDEAGKVKIFLGSNEKGVSFRCKLDRKPFKPCRSPKTYRNLDEGKHRIKVQARDAAGNRDPSPAVRRFRIEP